MQIDKLHLIKGEKSNLAFYYPTYSLLSINNSTFEILKGIKEANLAEVTKNDQFLKDDIENLMNYLRNILGRDVSKAEEVVESNPRNISRITLHISNDCNLRCQYCYAGGGNYNQDRGLMSINTSDKFVDFCANNFDSIGNIVFFGGEPLLNPEIIDFICRKFHEYKKTGIINYLPQFGMITNGTIINKNILSILNEYISFITVSIDGPKYLNDYNRVFANGKGSYDKIDHFIHTVKKETNVYLRYEATFTEYHVKQNVTYDTLKSFFSSEFGIDGVITDELSIESDMHKEYWNSSIYNTLSKTDLSNLPEGFWSILASVVEKKTKNMCLIYQDIFAISINGEIFPCHMNTGEPHLSLGNIASTNIFNTPDKFKEKFPLLFNIHEKSKICEDCWAQNLCGGCTMRWFYDEESKIYSTHPKKELCQINRKHIEKILLLISNIRQDSERWSIFLSYIEQNSKSILI